MSEPTPTLEAVLIFYQRALVAKVQMGEYNASWSPQIHAGFNATIAAHADLEQRYLAAVVERRRVESEDLKAQLDALDIEEARGRKRRG